jgi:muconolactone D-isomerase
MRFLVRIVVQLPGEWEEARKAELRQQERQRVLELMRTGTVLRLFRIAGETGNVGIWQADTLEELHDVLTALPMRPWMRLDLTPLLPHPHEDAFRDRHGALPAL